MKQLSLYICRYCYRRCQIGRIYGPSKEWGCTTCRAKFIVNDDDQIKSHTTELWTIIRNKTYRLYISEELNNANLTDEKNVLIYHFDTIPGITPENIESKITTILTFL